MVIQLREDMRQLIPDHLPRTRLPIFVRSKWWLFRILETISMVKEKAQGISQDSGTQWLFHGKTVNGKKTLLVFLSTIGEMNAIGIFLKKLLHETGYPNLVIMTDHLHYVEPFRKQYPDAHIAVLTGHSRQIRTLFDAFSPDFLILGEIPCRLSDAPCRLPFAAIYYAKKKNISVVMVNGWLYKQLPGCLIDTIEKKLFDRDYVQLIDQYSVQTDSVKEELITLGADKNHIHVSGNLKFDAVQGVKFDVENAKSPDWIIEIKTGERACIVAGCLTEKEEQEIVLDAFIALKKNIPDALLVIVPRHPEFKDRMTQLANLIKEKELNYIFKTDSDISMIKDSDVLVVNTVGELKDFYAISSICYVGVDHNVLEPIMYKKPVFVGSGWHDIYPSYPVYKLLIDSGVITEGKNSNDLCAMWLNILNSSGEMELYKSKTDEVLASHSGVCEKTIRLWSNGK